MGSYCKHYSSWHSSLGISVRSRRISHKARRIGFSEIIINHFQATNSDETCEYVLKHVAEYTQTKQSSWSIANFKQSRHNEHVILLSKLSFLILREWRGVLVSPTSSSGTVRARQFEVTHNVKLGRLLSPPWNWEHLIR